MITIDIRPCEPHRAFHALLVVSGLRRPPLSARFTIMARHDGKSRYVGPAGWEDKFTECRELAAGWDAEQKVLWLLLGPEVIEPLDRGPFNFTLLQTGEQITELAMPAPILLPGPDGLPPLAESHDKGVAALLPLPLTTPAAAFRATTSARTLFQTSDAHQVGPTVVESDMPPHGKDPSVKPVVLGIGVCLAAVLGVGFLLAGQGKDAKPPVSAVVASSPVTSPVTSPQRPLPIPAAPPPPVATDPAPISIKEADTAAASMPHPLPMPAAAPEPVVAPSTVAAPDPTSVPVLDAEPAAALPIAASVGPTGAAETVEDRAGPPPQAEPTPPQQAAEAPAARSACGGPPISASIPAIADSTTPEEAHCIVLGWIASGRTDDAVAALSSLRRSGYLPAMLELAKLYDPLSKHSTPPPAPEFARDEYRRIIQRAGDNPVGQEARHRLDALRDG